MKRVLLNKKVACPSDVFDYRAYEELIRNSKLVEVADIKKQFDKDILVKFCVTIRGTFSNKVLVFVDGDKKTLFSPPKDFFIEDATVDDCTVLSAKHCMDILFARMSGKSFADLVSHTALKVKGVTHTSEGYIVNVQIIFDDYYKVDFPYNTVLMPFEDAKFEVELPLNQVSEWERDLNSKVINSFDVVR